MSNNANTYYSLRLTPEELDYLIYVMDESSIDHNSEADYLQYYTFTSNMSKFLKKMKGLPDDQNDDNS